MKNLLIPIFFGFVFNSLSQINLTNFLIQDEPNKSTQIGFYSQLGRFDSNKKSSYLNIGTELFLPLRNKNIAFGIGFELGKYKSKNEFLRLSENIKTVYYESGIPLHSSFRFYGNLLSISNFEFHIYLQILAGYIINEKTEYFNYTINPSTLYETIIKDNGNTFVAGLGTGISLQYSFHNLQTLFIGVNMNFRAEEVLFSSSYNFIGLELGYRVPLF